MDTSFEKARQLAEELKANSNSLGIEGMALKIFNFTEEQHLKKCKKLPKEVIVQNLERRGKKIAQDNNIFKRKNWDNAVVVITENYK